MLSQGREGGFYIHMDFIPSALTLNQSHVTFKYQRHELHNSP